MRAVCPPLLKLHLLALTHTVASRAHTYINIRSKGVGTREAWVWGPSRVFAPRLAPTAAHRFLSAALHALHRHPPPPFPLPRRPAFFPPPHPLSLAPLLHNATASTAGLSARTRMHNATRIVQPARVECEEDSARSLEAARGLSWKMRSKLFACTCPKP